MSFLMRKARGAVVTIGIGAATSYFLDPQLGRQRRQDVLGRARDLLGAVRDERSAMQRSAHGDSDPTGGGLPSEAQSQESPPSEPLPSDVLPSDVLPTVPGEQPITPEPDERPATGRDLGALGAV